MKLFESLENRKLTTNRRIVIGPRSELKQVKRNGKEVRRKDKEQCATNKDV